MLIAVYAYAFQFYYDFSGYTDIAIGSALLLGIKLPPNFNAPTLRKISPISGGAGTSSFPTGCAIICIFSLPGKRSSFSRLYESGHHDGDRRAVARRELEFRGLGSAARRRVWPRSAVQAQRRRPRNRLNETGTPAS